MSQYTLLNIIPCYIRFNTRFCQSCVSITSYDVIYSQYIIYGIIYIIESNLMTTTLIRLYAKPIADQLAPSHLTHTRITNPIFIFLIYTYFPCQDTLYLLICDHRSNSTHFTHIQISIFNISFPWLAKCLHFVPFLSFCDLLSSYSLVSLINTLTLT